MRSFIPPETVNLHVTSVCNLRCKYCFGGFPSIPRPNAPVDWGRILEVLAAAGVRRVNFSGGEPTLLPNLAHLLRRARDLGLAASIVTNGTRLTDELISLLDVVALSIDSEDDSVSASLGRFVPGQKDGSYRALVEDVARRVRAASKSLKLNTVVTRLNAEANLVGLYLRLRPDKVKLLQFRPVTGENDATAQELAIDAETFQRFVERHRPVSSQGIWLVPEDAQTIADTYVMVNPEGRLFQHAPAGGHLRSSPLADVGLARALAEVGGYSREGFVRRGGPLDLREVARMAEDVELRDIFAAYPLNEVPRPLVTTCGGDRQRLSLAAVDWLRRVAESPEFEPDGFLTQSDAVIKLLHALPGSPREFSTLLPAEAGEDKPLFTDSLLLRLLLALAPERQHPQRWPDIASAFASRWARTRAGEGLYSSALHLALSGPALAYVLLESVWKMASAPLADQPVKFLGLLFLSETKAVEHLVAIALWRFRETPVVPQDERWRAELKLEMLFASELLPAAASQARARGLHLPAIDQAIAIGSEAPDAGRFRTALWLLRYAGRVDDVAKLLEERIRRSSAAELETLWRGRVDRLFTSPGWGREKVRARLGPVARALLERSVWPEHFWIPALGGGLLGNRRQALQRTAEILAEGLYLIAADPAVDGPVRIRAVEAFARTGIGQLAGRLSRLKSDPKVQDAVHVALKALAATAKGHKVDPEVGIRLALSVFLRSRP